MTAPGFVGGKTVEAPHSTGVEPPMTLAPIGATDCHHHISDLRFPKPGGGQVTPSTVSDYLVFKRRLGITRNIVIAASSYGDDNSCLVDALRQLGSHQARGVALVHPDVNEQELDRLHEVGVRGLRFYLAKTRVPTVAELTKIASRAHQRGWHVQIVADRVKEVLVDWEAALDALPCPVVIDHFGYAPQPDGEKSATGAVLRRLLDNGKTYVKLSAVYIQSKVGFPTYADMNPMAQALVQLAPDRLLWGTDWPHPGAGATKPDGAQLFDQLTAWAPDAEVRKQILVDNPQRLYWAN